MATLQEIIDYLDRKNPNHGMTDANVVKDLNDLHIDIYMQLKRLTNQYDISDDGVTGSGQFSYNLPDYCRIHDIIQILIGTDTSGTDYDEYSYAGLGDDSSVGKYYGRLTDGTYFLLDDDEPIQTTGLPIKIIYFRRPIELESSDLTQVPELDVDFHDLLKFGIVQISFEEGTHPDTELADYWQKKFDEKLAKVREALEDRRVRTPVESTTEEWW